jgi:DNA polymerase IV
MDLPINPEPPEIMHIDLNSAFATTEQQANPLLRGKPVGVTNRINDYSICITASYEAKALGISLGTRYREAKIIAPNFVMLEADPAKYQYVHNKLKCLFESYSPISYMKSIDEGIIDFTGMRGVLKGRTMEDIGWEIKQRIREEIGDYMSVNVGIGQNRWLAKVAAGFMKPDGLYVIDRQNLEVVYGFMSLVELPYIKARNKLRLNNAGIYTPLDFLYAPERVLTKQVFKSINGHHWYLKLRGYETEVDYGIHTVGRSYVLEHRTSDPEELAALFYKAAAKVARRLDKNKLAARGLMLNLGYAQEIGWDGTPVSGPRGWYERHIYGVSARRGDQLYVRAMDLYSRSPQGRVVSSLAMTAYAVEPFVCGQPTLFDDYMSCRDRLEDAMNAVNDKYGELTIVPATVARSKNPMKDKIPFGTVRYFS